MEGRGPDVAAEARYAVRFDPRPVLVPVAGTIAAAAIGALLTGELAGSAAAGSVGAAVLFFRRTWLVLRRRFAFAVLPSGVYLGPTLSRPRQHPEFIPWEKISALEVAWDREDDNQPYIFVRGRETETATAPGPRIAYRKIEGWHLDRQAMEQAVRHLDQPLTTKKDPPPAA